MQRLILQKPVTVRGYGATGLTSASITFSPMDGDQRGWFVRSSTGEVFPVEASKLSILPFRRVGIGTGKCSIAIWEHIGSLIAMGIDGVLVDSTLDPPFWGRTIELWHALRPHCIPSRDPEELDWFTVSRPLVICDPCNPHREVRFEPECNRDNPSLLLDVSIDYKGIGSSRWEGRLGCDELSAIYSAYTQGIKPPLPRWFLKIFWRHYNKVSWPASSSQDSSLQEWTFHRVNDALGVLMSIRSDIQLAGRFVSICGGHKLDIQLAKNISSYLCGI